MSYTQFGYSSYAASSPLVIGGSSGQNSCYERTGVSPESQYDTRLYPRLPSYASSYQTDANLDPATTFYAPALNSTYGMKESSDPWRSISQSASYYYDPTLAAYGYGGLDFNGARRKNVTRDSTSTLKAWLNEHRKNPYPTKGEKIMLAIITKMTLTQVSTWFANARRRLKKENKMTWEPRNKAEAHDDESPAKREDAMDKEEDPAGFREEGCGDKADVLRIHPSALVDASEMDLGQHHRNDGAYRSTVGDQHLHQHYEDSHPSADMLSAASSSLEGAPSCPSSGYTPSVSSQSSSPDLGSIDTYMGSHHRPAKDHPTTLATVSAGQCFSAESHLYKPKIWSLADTATNKVVETALMPYAHQDLCSQTGWGAAPSAAKGSGSSFQSCAVPFQRFGNYSCSLHGFNPIALQTDTPPQTPPNMKVTAAHQAATVPSSAYIETHGSAYLGQSALCAQDLNDAHMQEEKMESFSSSHSSGLPQSSTSNPNSDCISEDYDDPSQFSTPSVR